MESEINKLVSNLHNKVHNIRVLTKFTDFKTRLQFANSFIVGKLNYMLPLYSNLTVFNFHKLHKLLMTAARVVVGNYCYKKSCKYILDKCKWMNIGDMIKYRGLSFLHKILTTHQPTSLFNLFKTNRHNRGISMVTLKHIPKSKKFTNFFINKYISTYNSLDLTIKRKSLSQFKKEIKQWIPSHPSDTMD